MSQIDEKVCYICGSKRFVDAHHIDDQHGRLSPETVLLCRRCHRTLHDLSVSWFDDELLDRAMEVENMRRKIFSEPFLEKGDIERSDYWYKKHGIRREKSIQEISTQPLVRPGIVEPICGWKWIEENKGKIYPEQGITVLYDAKPILALAFPSPSVKRGLIRAVMTMAGRIHSSQRATESSRSVGSQDGNDS